MEEVEMVGEQTTKSHWSDATTRESCLYEDKKPKETPSPIVEDTSSIFGDSDCGEPLYEQRLLIDFTPNEAIDNDFAQKKCVEFWNFINSLPQIKNFMVYPERHSSDSSETSLVTKGSSTSDVKEDSTEVGRTAVSMLKLVQDKGFINRTFEAKMPQSSCTLGSREYKELEEVKPLKKKKRDPCCRDAYCFCKKKLVSSISYAEKSSALTTMMKNMEDWDTKHPKSMEPPGHAPSLQHCILQRAYYSSPP